MPRLIECETDCNDRDAGGGSQNCLESGTSCSDDTTVLRSRIPSHKSRKRLTSLKQKLCQNKYINRESRMGLLSRCARGKEVFRHVLDNIESDDVIRDIMLRLPWSTISSLDTLCRRSMEKLLDRAFVARYLAENPVLLGFSYKKALPATTSNPTSWRAEFVPLVAAAKYCPVYCDLLHQNVEETQAAKSYSDWLRKDLHSSFAYSSDLPVCSCDGIHLRYHSRLNANFISLHNPITGQAVYLPNSPPGDSYHYPSVISYGLAIDYFSSRTPELKVVEVIRMSSKEDYYLHVSTFSSKTCCWQSKKHYLEPFLGKNYRLSSRGTYLKGYMYWMRGETGIVAYDMQNEVFSFRLLKIPGEPVPHLCFCHEISHENWPSCQLNNVNCVCRYLGVSQGRVFYIRVTGDSEICMWIIESGKWSRGQCFSLQCIPVPLLCGRILSIDPQDCKLLYILLKTKIVSYHLELHELKEIHTILFEGENDGHFTHIPPILSYETPRLPASLAIHDFFKNIFGSSLCCKDSCWVDACRKYMIHPDAHVHIQSDAQSTVSYGNELPFWFGGQSDKFWKTNYSRFVDECEMVTL